MTQTMTTGVRPRRTGLMLATVGMVLAALAILAVAVAIVGRGRFSVGGTFLGVVAAGMLLGSLLLLIGVLMLPQRWTWRGIALIVWALIGLTSPLFGWVFLYPLGAMVLLSPLAIAALVGLRKT